METKHTPGPWLYRGKDSSVREPANDPPYTYGRHVFAFREDMEPSDEDLALILAAPDLLASLKRLSEVADQIWIRASEEEMSLLRAAWKEADAAIAKAEGRS